ncbi:unnamed protein product [Ambrosiozyma monospora]|uniref:Unnamed protein product n=1 Tax=Ambrosiozyma monospora TaxID=43982 RepID=A0ACB5TKA1_AMBMO|nr:unnamed protein product [Ambrosiozyma monospora]
MFWKNIAFILEKPFVNLTPRARVLQSLRLGTSFLTLVGLLLLYFLPYMTHNVFVAKLDCSHADVSNGLFSSLSSSVNSDGEISSGLTTSEIELLVDYVENEVKTAPQVITSNLRNWCFGSYNSTETYDHYQESFTQSRIMNYHMQCTKTDSNYVFDYRGELSTIGLNILLSYAYSTSDVSSDRQAITSSTKLYSPDAEYSAILKLRKSLNQSVFFMIVGGITVHGFMLLMGIIYYGNRGLKKDDQSMPNYIKQLYGYLASFTFLTILGAIVIQTYIITTVKSDVKSQLGSFGLSVHRGGIWFSIGWVVSFLSFVSAVSWGGPVWCGVIEAERPVRLRDYGDDEIDYVGTPMRSSFMRPKFDGNWSEDSVEMTNLQGSRETSPLNKDKDKTPLESARERDLHRLLKRDTTTRAVFLNEKNGFTFGANTSSLLVEEEENWRQDEDGYRGPEQGSSSGRTAIAPPTRTNTIRSQTADKRRHARQIDEFPQRRML